MYQLECVSCQKAGNTAGTQTRRGFVTAYSKKARGNKPDRKGHALCGPTYMTCLEESSVQRRKWSDGCQRQEVEGVGVIL